MSSGPAKTLDLSLPTSATFRAACAKFATGITIATVLGPEGEPHGMTANSFTSVSLQPPVILICVDHSAAVLPLFVGCTRFGVNVLSESQQSLSEKFAQRGRDRFENIEWVAGPGGAPLLPAALAVFECRVLQRIECGDHTIFLAEVEAASYREGKPLVFFNSGYTGLNS